MASLDAPRSIPSWAAQGDSEHSEEALKALETYKKKDPAKGLLAQSQMPANEFLTILLSGRTVQGRRQRANNEAELLQDNVFQSLPSSHSVPAEGARVESWGPFGKFSRPGLHCLICTFAHPHATLTRRFCPICLIA